MFHLSTGKDEKLWHYSVGEDVGKEALIHYRWAQRQKQGFRREVCNSYQILNEQTFGWQKISQDN